MRETSAVPANSAEATHDTAAVRRWWEQRAPELRGQGKAPPSNASHVSMTGVTLRELTAR